MRAGASWGLLRPCRQERPWGGSVCALPILRVPRGTTRGAHSFQSPEPTDHAVPRARPPLPLHTHSRRGLGAPVSAQAPAYPGPLGCRPVANTTRL